jgi:DNA invertase Pin-like site-specific DNA recombinase
VSTEALKVTAGHLARNAYLHARQSTPRQVLDNTESAARQYALRQRAVALGWPAAQIITIDTNRGHFGASATDREASSTRSPRSAWARAGIVLGLEVSRLARNYADWRRPLEIWALTSTLIGLELAGKTRAIPVRRRMKRLQWRS